MRRIAVLLLVGLPTVGAGAPLAASEAEPSFTMYGSGWGHGIGMSQYGAYGLALEGWGPDRIIRHYYSGVAVERREAPVRVLRVGLLQSRPRVTLEVVAGTPELRAGSQRLESLAPGDVRVVTMHGGRYRVEDPGGEAVVEAADRLQVRGGVVRIEEWGRALGRGRIELAPEGDGAFHVVAAIDPEEYLYGLGEVPSSWPQAVLRAQAIAARTYAFRRAAEGGRTGCGCHIYGDTRDQAYVGFEKETGADGDRWVQAVRASAGRVATFQGELISTLYSSSSGGYTESVENVWGGAPTPYLKGKCDPGDFVESNPNRTWSVTMTGGELADRFRSAFGWDVGDVEALEVAKRGVSGRIARVVVKGSGGFSRAISGWDLRSALGLKDTRIWIGEDHNVTGAIRGAYDDLLCKPGLPAGAQRSVGGGRWQPFQRGRMYSEGGAGFWLRGPVLDAYLAAGGPEGDLGFPRSGITKRGDGAGADFEGGTVTCDAAGECRVDAG